MSFGNRTMQSPPSASASRDDLLQQIGFIFESALATATESARAGNYEKAERILAGLIGDGLVSPDVLDLQARIRAQQGHYREAEALWARAEDLDPSNPEYAEARRRVQTVQRRPAWLAAPIFWITALGMAVVSLLAVVFGRALLDGDDAASLAVSKNAAHAEGARPRSGASPLEVENQIQSESPTPTPAPPAAQPSEPGPRLPDALAADVQMPGIAVRRENDELVLTFEHGLFQDKNRLTHEARDLLTGLGAALSRHRQAISLRIVGHTDDRSVRKGSHRASNLELGAERGLAVARHLASTQGGANVPITVETAGAEGAPFPNDSAENRARNRTVTIRIALRRDGEPPGRTEKPL